MFLFELNSTHNSFKEHIKDHTCVYVRVCLLYVCVCILTCSIALHVYYTLGISTCLSGVKGSDSHCHLDRGSHVAPTPFLTWPIREQNHTQRQKFTTDTANMRLSTDSICPPDLPVPPWCFTSAWNHFHLKVTHFC